MEKKIDTATEFSLVRRAKSFSCAGRGLAVFVRTTPNARIQLFILLLVVLGGLFFSIKSIEWLFLILASGMVLAAEAFNTAIEIDIDLTSPEYHPYARDTKDVAAGAVLISALTALMVGLVVFVPYIF